MKQVKGAKVLIVDGDNNVLVLRRSGTHPYIPFTPDLPGGKIEHGETPVVTACRETYEETGITLNEGELEQVGHRNHTAYAREYDLYLFMTRCAARPDVKISWEHDKFSWEPLATLAGLDEGFQPLLEALQEKTD